MLKTQQEAEPFASYFESHGNAEDGVPSVSKIDFGMRGGAWKPLYKHPPKPAPLPQPKLSGSELEILEAHECEWCAGTGVVEVSHDDPAGFADCSWCGGKRYIFPQPVGDLAHELWAAAQLAPGEGIEDGVARLEVILQEQQVASVPQGLEEFIAKYQRHVEGLFGIPCITVPEFQAWMAGHARVPVEPTHEMCLAGNALLPSSHNSDEAFRAMLAASQQEGV